MPQKWADKTVRGRTFTVYLTEAGDFRTMFEDEDIQAPSWPELEKKLQRLTKGVKITVPFVRIEEPWHGPRSARRLVATGIHASSRRLLLRDSGGKAVQDNRGTDLANLTDQEFTELNTLIQNCAKADAAYKQFQERHNIDVDELVKQAIEGAGDDPE